MRGRTTMSDQPGMYTEESWGAGEARRGERRPARMLLLVALALCVAFAGVMTALVAGGTLPNPLGRARAARAARAATQGAIPATAPQYLRAHGDVGVCQVIPQAPHMVTPQELQNAETPGWRRDADGSAHPCVKPGLYIPAPTGGAPGLGGKVIMVSIAQQWLWVYQDHQMVYATPVTTGQAYLWTPQGEYHISEKITDTMFYSPWPPGTPYYYTPEHVNYAMYFRDQGYYIHDAPWRHAFGPGTNEPHTDPDGTYEDGSHGCVNVATGAAAWIYKWADIGTTVTIVD